MYVKVPGGPSVGLALEGSSFNGAAVVGPVTSGGSSLLGTADGGIDFVLFCVVLVLDTDDVVAARSVSNGNTVMIYARGTS